RSPLVRANGLVTDRRNLERLRHARSGARGETPMPLTVLSVSYPLAPVKESTAGGAEQVLAALDAGIVAAGEHSLVLAPAGSKVRGTLLPSSPVKSNLTEEFHTDACREYQRLIEIAIRDFHVDIVHMHGLDFYRYLPESGTPVVVTLHLPLHFYPLEVFRSPRPHLHLICVSHSQAEKCPEGFPRQVIANGVALPFSDFPRAKGNYLVCMGRICPEKGFHLAMDAATECNIPLVLAGTVFGYGSHQEYFETSIKPRLVPPHRFVGAVG